MSISGGPNIIKNGLVLYLDAADDSSYVSGSTVWKDISGNSNNGTLTNGPTFNTGSKGNIAFDGVDDHVINSSTSNIPTGNSNRTIQCWAYPKTDINCFIQLGTSGGGNQVYIVQYYNYPFPVVGTLYLFTDGINISNNITITGSQLPILNAWNYITFGNSGQNWFYYLNGKSTLSGTWPTTLNTIGQKYIVGRRDEASPYGYVNGNISQVSIYNRALSADEILQNFNSTKGRYNL